MLLGTHGENLYLALELIDDESHREDARWELRFDNDGDGTMDESENQLVLTGSDYEDPHASASSCCDLPGVLHGGGSGPQRVCRTQDPMVPDRPSGETRPPGPDKQETVT